MAEPTGEDWRALAFELHARVRQLEAELAGRAMSAKWNAVLERARRAGSVSR